MSHVWNVKALDYKVSQDGLANVVTLVHWTCSKTVGEHSGIAYGTQSLSEPDANNYVAWADITENTAISWCHSEMGNTQVTSIESSIDAQITEKTTPTTGSDVPW